VASFFWPTRHMSVEVEHCDYTNTRLDFRLFCVQVDRFLYYTVILIYSVQVVHRISLVVTTVSAFRHLKSVTIHGTVLMDPMNVIVVSNIITNFYLIHRVWKQRAYSILCITLTNLNQWRFYVGARGHRPPKSCLPPNFWTL